MKNLKTLFLAALTFLVTLCAPAQSVPTTVFGALVELDDFKNGHQETTTGLLRSFGSAHIWLTGDSVLSGPHIFIDMEEFVRRGYQSRGSFEEIADVISQFEFEEFDMVQVNGGFDVIVNVQLLNHDGDVIIEGDLQIDFGWNDGVPTVASLLNTPVHLPEFLKTFVDVRVGAARIVGPRFNEYLSLCHVERGTYLQLRSEFIEGGRIMISTEDQGNGPTLFNVDLITGEIHEGVQMTAHMGTIASKLIHVLPSFNEFDGNFQASQFEKEFFGRMPTIEYTAFRDEVIEGSFLIPTWNAPDWFGPMEIVCVNQRTQEVRHGRMLPNGNWRLRFRAGEKYYLYFKYPLRDWNAGPGRG